LVVIFNVTYFLVGMFPVLGLLLQYIPLNGRKWYYTFAISFTAVISLFFCVAPYTEAKYPVKYLYLIYGAYFLVVLTCFVKKHGYSYFNKLLGITFILAYVTSEWWEIPVFVCGHLGWLGKTYEGSINQIYLILAFYLLIKYSKFSFNARALTLMAISLVIASLIQVLFPLYEFSSSYWMIARVAAYICLGAAFLKYSRVTSVGSTGSAF